MKAVILSEDRRPVLASLPEPTPGPNQVVLRVDFCGVCGSDLHAATFDIFRVGVIMGHEFSGRIVEFGSNVEGWELGERVCVNPNGAYCGTCANCRRGLYNLCPEILNNSVGCATPGGFAEFAVVNARTLHRLPDEVTPKQGAWIEPASVALRAVRRSGIQLGDDALVYGAGPIGLLVVKMLRLAGAGMITVIEPNASRRSRAKEIGADILVDPTSSDGLGQDSPPVGSVGFAFDCVGSKVVTEAAVHALRPHGCLTIVGVAQHPIGFAPTELLFKELQIKGSFIYNEEFGETIKLMASGKLNVEPLTSGVRPLHTAVEAIEEMRAGKDIIKFLIGVDA